MGCPKSKQVQPQKFNSRNISDTNNMANSLSGVQLSPDNYYGEAKIMNKLSGEETENLKISREVYDEEKVMIVNKRIAI